MSGSREVEIICPRGKMVVSIPENGDEFVVKHTCLGAILYCHQYRNYHLSGNCRVGGCTGTIEIKEKAGQVNSVTMV